jgi:RNA polymerase sigma factor (TIGR02999 family)
MTASSSGDVTHLLRAWSDGDKAALDKLVPLVYDELRRRAKSYMRAERSDHTLQATALVNEAYIRLVDYRSMRWQDRVHFFAVAAQLMRRILVDHARRRNRAKREGRHYKLSLEGAISIPEPQDVDVISLDDALSGLEAIDPQKCRIVELRFFSGLTIEETAKVLAVAPDTVRRHWKSAQSWLHREMSKGSRDDA